MTDQDCLRRFAAHIDWLDILRTIDEATWDTPVAPGKWSMKALILHMTNWDRYLLSETLPAIREGKDVVFPEFDSFNQRSVEQATSGISSDKVIKESIETRRALIQAIEGRGRLSQQAEAKLFPIIEDFIEHDHHHEQQIDTFLHRSGQERPS